MRAAVSALKMNGYTFKGNNSAIFAVFPLNGKICSHGGGGGGGGGGEGGRGGVTLDLSITLENVLK